MKFLNLSNEIKLRVISELIVKLVNFLLIPFITYKIGIDDYGIYIVLHSIINGLLPIFLLGLNFTIIKKLATVKSIRINSLNIFNSLFLVSLLFLLLLPFLLIFFRFFDFENHHFAYYILVITYLITIQLILFEFLRSKFKSNLYSSFQIIDSCCFIVMLSLIGFLAELSITKILYLIILNKIIGLSGIFIYLLKSNIIKFKYFNLEKQIFKKYFYPGIIFILLGISEWLINFSDKIILSYYLPSVYLGLYFTTGMIASGIISLGSIFWWDLLPKLTKFKKQNDDEKIYRLIKDKYSIFIDYCIILSLILIILSPLIQTIILNSEFKITYSIYLIFFISVFSNQISTGWEFFCYINKKNKFVLTNSIIWGILSFILYILLIPILKLEGALISLLITKIGYSYSLMIYARKIGFNYNIFEKNQYLKFINFFLCFLILLNLKDLNIYENFEKISYFINLIIILSFYFCFNYLTKKLT